MNKGEKITESEKDSNESSLLEFLRWCPIDEETWKYILDRPTDPPRVISFDDWRFKDEDESKTKGEPQE